jgi:hypothetical protein
MNVQYTGVHEGGRVRTRVDAVGGVATSYTSRRGYQRFFIPQS